MESLLPRMSSKGMSWMSLIECQGRLKRCETGVGRISELVMILDGTAMFTKAFVKMSFSFSNVMAR